MSFLRISAVPLAETMQAWTAPSSLVNYSHHDDKCPLNKQLLKQLSVFQGDKAKYESG